MKKYLIIPIIFSCIYCSTNQHKEKTGNTQSQFEIPVIDLTGIEQADRQGLPISEIVDTVDVEYISLETTASSMVEVIFDAQLNRHNVFIYNKTGLLMFDRDGKFIRVVGTYGKGPNEHLGIVGFSCSDSLISLISNYTKKMLLYTAKGEFFQSLPVNANAGKPDFINDHCLSISRRFGSSYDKDYYICYAVNLKGDTLWMRKMGEQIPVAKDVYVQANFQWTYNDMLYTKETLNDTIYTITSDCIVPRYILKTGKYKMPVDLLWDMKKKEKTAHQYIDLGTIFENAGHLYLSISYDNQRIMAVYNKATQQTDFFTLKGSRVNEHGIVEGGYFTNDIDGGFPIYGLRSVKGNKLMTILYPYELDEMQMEKANIRIKNKKKEEEFQQLKKSMDSSDNPLLVIYSVK